MPIEPRPRKYRPHGRRYTPYDPVTGQYHPASMDQGQIGVFTVLEVGTDAMLCLDAAGNTILVAKALKFRKSLIAAESQFAGVAWENYVVGDQILAARMHRGVYVDVEADDLTDVEEGIGPDAHRVDWEDINTSGRNWPGRPRRAQVVSEGDDTITVYFYDASGTVGTEATTVAKPMGIRRSDYEGATYDGATYAYVSASARTASGDAQNILPSYRVGTDIYVYRPVGGTGAVDGNGDAVPWQDMNGGGSWNRWWLQEPPEE